MQRRGEESLKIDDHGFEQKRAEAKSKRDRKLSLGSSMDVSTKCWNFSNYFSRALSV